MQRDSHVENLTYMTVHEKIYRPIESHHLYTAQCGLVFAVHRRTDLYAILLAARLLLGRVPLGMDLLSSGPRHAYQDLQHKPPVLGDDLPIDLADPWTQPVDMAIVRHRPALGDGGVALEDPSCALP